LRRCSPTPRRSIAAMTERPDRNLAMELVRVTEAAALAAGRWIGRGDKNTADQAAVDAMRLMLDTVQMDGVVVIGEGEKDEAPMLYNGEHVGSGEGPQVDVAVDPLEGTRLTALGQPNAIAVMALSERGTFFFPGVAFCVGSVGRRVRAIASRPGAPVGGARGGGRTPAGSTPPARRGSGGGAHRRNRARAPPVAPCPPPTAPTTSDKSQRLA